MASVVICEKSTQVAKLREAVGNRFGDIIPLSGHVLTLIEPQELREEWKKWSTQVLWPGEFYKTKPAQGRDAQQTAQIRRILDNVSSALRKADQVVIATDFDREGQLIGQEVLTHFGYSGKAFRLKFNAMDPESLRKAFAEMRPLEEYEGLYWPAWLANKETRSPTSP